MSFKKLSHSDIETPKDAFIVKNVSLQSEILGARRSTRPFFSMVKKQMSENALNPKIGTWRSGKSIKIEMTSETPYRSLLATIVSSFPEYEFSGEVPGTGSFELWFGTGDPTKSHIDIPVFIKSGSGIAMQFWILLDSYREDDENIDDPDGTNCLECLLPMIDGPVLNVPDPKVVTLDGIKDYVSGGEQSVIGGRQISFGDILVFKNPVMHRSQGNPRNVRVALAIRAYLKSDLGTGHDIDQRLWLQEELRKNPKIVAYMRKNKDPYHLRLLSDIEVLPSRQANRAVLQKRDNNDLSSLRARLARLDFRNAISKFKLAG